MRPPTPSLSGLDRLATTSLTVVLVGLLTGLLAAGPAPAQVRGTILPVGESSLGNLKVTVYASGDTSSTVTSTGAFSLNVDGEDDTLMVRVDAPTLRRRQFHPALFRAPASELASGITVLMIPLRWTIEKGVYAGETVQISMHEALSTPEPRFGHYLGGGLYQGTYYTRLKAWRPDDRPIPVAIYNETPDVERITAQDSLDLWEHLEEIEETFGRDLFRSATPRDVGWNEDDLYGAPDGVLGIRVDTSTCGRGGAARGDLIWSWPSTSSGQWESPPLPRSSTDSWQSVPPDAFRISGRTIEEASTEYCHANFDHAGGIPPGLVKHETGHAMGYGHTCRISSIMTAYNCNPDSFHWLGTLSFSRIDVAYWELKQHVYALAEQHETRFGVLPALFGERALLRGLRPVPSREEWSEVVFKASRSSGAMTFGDTGVEIALSDVRRTEEAVMWVGAYDQAPVRPVGISDTNVGRDRIVIEHSTVPGSDFDFGPGTEVRIDVGTLSGVEDPRNVAVYRRPARATASFQKLATRYDSGAHQLVVTTDRLGAFVFASNTEPLPVELTRLEATSRGDRVLLRWQTASETGNAGFEVQRRRAESETWQTVGFVEGAGTTAAPTTYRFEDEDLPFEADDLHYRLEQVDVGGSSTFSRLVTVRRETPRRLALKKTFPNPVRHRVTIHYAVPERRESGGSTATLRLYDVLGRQVQSVAADAEAGRHEVELPVGDLASGVYVLRLRSGETVRTRRLIVAR